MTHNSGFCSLHDGGGGGSAMSLSLCPPSRLCTNNIPSSSLAIPLSPTISPRPPPPPYLSLCITGTTTIGTLGAPTTPETEKSHHSHHRDSKVPLNTQKKI